MGAKLCGAKAKSTGEPCKREAGWGTDHLGEGRCRFHGGATPIKSGRYSTVKREGFQQLLEKYMDDPDPLNVMPELAAARALLEDYLARYDELRDALLALNRERAKEGKRPVRVPDVEDVIKSIRTITRIAHDEKKSRLEGAISRRHLMRILAAQRTVIEEEVDDERTRQRIFDGFLGIKLA